MQNARSRPLYAFVLDSDITDETENIKFIIIIYYTLQNI